MAEFTMPSLGADMDEGMLQEWLVQPGDQVRKGDPIAVVETSKSAIEVECFEDGTVERLLVEPGTTVPVGAPLALIGTGGKPSRKRTDRSRSPKQSEPDAAAMKHPEPTTEEPAPSRLPPRAAPTHGGGDEETGPLVRHLAERSGIELGALHGSGRGGRITRADVERASAVAGSRPRMTPLARRLAGELGVDPVTVKGTGKDGVVRAVDVRTAASGATARTAPPRARSPRARGSARSSSTMRRAIAEVMERANRDIPHYYLSTTVDMATAMHWIHAHNRISPVGDRLIPACLMLKAAARAAHEVSELNGYWNEGHFIAGEGVQLGVAVSLRGGGLVDPVLHDAETLALPALMRELKGVVSRARSGRLRSSDVSEPTITVSDLGDRGAECVFGVIHPPQVALVGFGRVVDRPAAVQGLLGVRPQVTVTLAADHRATDGAVGSRYLTAVDRLLQKPEEL